MSDSRGHTLLELLLVLGLISILTLGSLSFPAFFKSRPLKLQAEEVIRLLDETQFEAQTRGQTMELRFKLSTPGLEIYLYDEFSELIAKRQKIPLSQGALFSNSSFGRSGNSATSAWFYPSGSQSPGSLRISNSKESCIISQSLRGRRRVVCN